MKFNYVDKLYKRYSLFIVRAFNSLNREFQALAFDELNAGKAYKVVSGKVEKTYKKIYDELIDILILLSLYYFEDSCDTVVEVKGNKIKYYIGKKDGFRKEKTFDAEDFVKKYILKDNKVVKYVFKNEYERKLARSIETILMSEDKTDLKKEIDKALKYWNRQAKQAGDNIAMESYIEGIRASGYSYVKWVTQKDIKVCSECAERDGKIFEIDKIFIPLHYNCRCNLVPYDK